MNLTKTQLHALLMAAPGLAFLLLTPSLMGIRLESIAHGLTPAALVRYVEAAAAAQCKAGTAQISAATIARGAESPSIGANPGDAVYFRLTDLIVNSQPLCDVGDTRAP